MNITTKDPARFARELARGVDQIPFATSLAINNTALSIQDYQRRHNRIAFRIRNQMFWDRAIKIKPFARRGSPVAVLAVDPPGGLERADIVARHEEEGVRRPVQSRALAVPLGARRNVFRSIPRALRPRNMRWLGSYVSPRTGTGIRIYYGQQRFWMFRRPDGTGLLFRRKGRGVGQLEVLYTFRRQTPVPARLNFVTNAEFVFAREFPEHFAAAFRRAAETAR